MSSRPAFSYVRFSSPAQARGDSQRRQREGFLAWCEAHGATPVEDYRDLGVSAFRGKNVAEGALRAFLGAIEAGKVPRGAVLVVESLDRLSRDAVNRALPVFLQIINAGVSVATLTDGHVYDAESPNMMLELMYSLLIMSRANEESATKSRRLLASWEARRRRAESEGGPITSICPAWLRLRGDAWEIIPERASVVRSIFQLAAEGAGFTAIARALNAAGTPGPRAAKWSTATVRLILDSRAPIGEFTPHRFVGGRRVPLAPLPGYYPAIVPVELWAAATRMRASREVRARSAAPHSNPFRGVIFDPDGHAFHVRVQKAKGKAYVYLQTQAGNEGRAPRQAWRLDEFLAFFVAVASECWRLPVAPVEDEAGARALRLEAVSARVANLVDAIARGGASDALLRALEAAEGERAAILAEAPPARSPRDSGAIPVDWSDPDQRAAAIGQRVRRIVVECRRPRWFSVEFFDRPEPVTWRETEGGEVVVEGLHPEAAAEIQNVIRGRFA